MMLRRAAHRLSSKQQVWRSCSLASNTRWRGLFSKSKDVSEAQVELERTRRQKFEEQQSELTQLISSETEVLMSQVLLPMNRDHNGPLEEESDERTPLPFVFLLGNHSSGKSSFINHVLQRRVQNTGVAPTDDGFTIIVPGQKDLDQDGPSLIGDPDMGFSGLRSYGPSLIHHTQLKIRKDLALSDIILVDSPGMIDSPIDSTSSVSNTTQGRNDRGYDFAGVTRWFAERADVILLFFDPDKPGTTGETLSVLTSSLAGMDHKLHIVLNKVDQFKKIHDFARAYGSLCWNLSKVIPRKDLPRIYTMYTPVTTDKGNAGREFKYQDQHRQPEPFNMENAQLSWKSSLQDLEAQREDVVSEVHRAPSRRLDNMITHLYDSARLLRMHLVMSEAVRNDFQSARKKILFTAGGVGLAGNVVSLAALYLVPSIWSFSATLSASSIAGAAGVYLYGNYQLQEKSKTLSSDSALDALFRRIYVREIADNDQYVQSLWQRVRLPLKSAIDTFSAGGIPRVTSGELRQLDAIIDSEVPALRRKAAPQHRD